MVIAIIAVLVAILLPAVQQAREAARNSQCKNNLKQMGVALHNYHDVHSALPYAVSDASNGGLHRGPSWYVRILPYLEQNASYDKLTFDGTDFTMQNGMPNRNWKVMVDTKVPTFRCPSSPLDPIRVQSTNTATQALGAPTSIAYQVSDYVGLAGSYDDGSTLACCPTPTAWTGYYRSNYNGVLVSLDNLNPNVVKFSSIIDGTTMTAAIAEQSDYQYSGASRYDRRASNWDGGLWACGRGGSTEWWINITVNRSRINYDGPNNGNENPYYRHTNIRSSHRGGANLVFTDGAVHFVSDNIDFGNLTRMIDRQDLKQISIF